MNYRNLTQKSIHGLLLFAPAKAELRPRSVYQSLAGLINDASHPWGATG